LRLLAYARLAESTLGKSQQAFFNSISFSAFSISMPLIDNRTLSMKSILPFAVIADLRVYVGEMLRDSYLINLNQVNLDGVTTSLLHLATNPWNAKHGGLASGCHDLSEMTRLLLQHGADKSALFCNLTPFQFLLSDHCKSHALFPAKGVAPAIPENRSIRVPRAIKRVPSAMFQTVKVLLQHGQDPNMPIGPDIQGGISSAIPSEIRACQALHIADAELTRLLEYKANVNARDNGGYTPLDITIRHDKIYIGNERNELDTIMQLRFPDNRSRREIYERLTLLVGHSGCITSHSETDLPLLLDWLVKYYTLDPRLETPPRLK
jgi:hypothetical protein